MVGAAGPLWVLYYTFFLWSFSTWEARASSLYGSLQVVRLLSTQLIFLNEYSKGARQKLWDLVTQGLSIFIVVEDYIRVWIPRCEVHCQGYLQRLATTCSNTANKITATSGGVTTLLDVMNQILHLYILACISFLYSAIITIRDDSCSLLL